VVALSSKTASPLIAGEAVGGFVELLVRYGFTMRFSPSAIATLNP